MDKISISLLYLFLIAGYQAIFSQDNVPPSTSPPNGLNPQNIPMLVSIGFDDNTCPTGIKWACDFLRDKVNNSHNGNPLTFDGTPVRVTFLIIAQWPNDEWNIASMDGHEIGNHTLTHHEGGLSWTEDVQYCNDTIAKYCPNATIYGFRTPRLEYDAGTWSAVKSFGFTYDCSIEHDNWGSPVWPYTLNNGLHSSANLDGKTPPSNMGGTWEIPVHELNGMTGFDFNYYDAGKANAYGNALKQDLDSRYSGNRCPLIINAHTEYYSEEWPEENPNIHWNSTIEQRREILADVIDYALTKPDVRIVPIIDIIRWMRNPVELGATYISDNAQIAGAAIKAQIKKVLSTSIDISVPKAGIYSLVLYSANGRRIKTVFSGCLAQGSTSVNYRMEAIHEGLYILKLLGADRRVSAVKKVMILVD